MCCTAAGGGSLETRYRQTAVDHRHGYWVRSMVRTYKLFLLMLRLTALIPRAEDMARAYPHAKVIGIDIVPPPRKECANWTLCLIQLGSESGPWSLL